MRRVHLGANKKRRMGRAIQPQIDIRAQTGQRLTTSQIIYLFSEHFSYVSCLFTEKSSQIPHPSSSSSIWSQEQAPSVNQHWLSDQLRWKSGFPTVAMIQRSSLLFSVLDPAKLNVQAASSSKRSQRKPMYEEKTLNMKENEVLPSPVVIHHES